MSQRPPNHSWHRGLTQRGQLLAKGTAALLVASLPRLCYLVILTTTLVIISATFTDEETGTGRLHNLPKATHAFSPRF